MADTEKKSRTAKGLMLEIVEVARVAIEDLSIDPNAAISMAYTLWHRIELENTAANVAQQLQDQPPVPASPAAECKCERCQWLRTVSNNTSLYALKTENGTKLSADQAMALAEQLLPVLTQETMSIIAKRLANAIKNN